MKKAITFKGKPQVEMHFGTANICTGIGQSTKTRNPIVTFGATSTATETAGNCETDAPEPTIIMEFSSMKSIDVVITQLARAKQILLQEFLNK